MKLGTLKKLLPALALSLLMTVNTGAALASTGVGVGVGINGGPLGFSLPGPVQLDDVDLTGFDQTVGGSLGLIDITDARGTGAGWSLIVTAGDFLNPDGSGNAIPADGFTVDPAPAVIKIAGNTGPEAFFGPLAQPLTLLTARADTGMGRFQTNPDLSLVVPAETPAGTYESTVTVTIVSGP